MKWKQRYWSYLIVLINLGFWLGLIAMETSEYVNAAYFYEQMDVLKANDQYEAYLNASTIEKAAILKATTVDPERLSKYTYAYCLKYTILLFLPFIVLIYTNWLLLIPRLLAQKKYWRYIAALVAVTLTIAWPASFHDSFSDKSQLLTGDSAQVLFEFNAYMEAVGAGMLSLLLSSPVFFSYSWFVQQNKIGRLENERLTTELALLKSQINPHFFFNTLNNLYSLTLDNSNQASDVILKLSDLMRYTIYEGKKQQVPLEQEMACLDNYLSLQTIRLKRPVDISFTKEILDPQLQVPPLLFLTFVENAFKHGVNTFREGAFVDIILRSSATHLYFSVHNNYEASARPVGGGSGLENIRRRLKLLYPDGQHRLEIVDHDPGFNVQLEIQLK